MLEEIYTGENAAPDREPERQFYFIKKMQEIAFAREQATGRKMTYHISTFGCQMNFKDSEKLAGVLEEIGFVEVEDEKADFCLYNTCTVRENANSRVYGRLGYLGKLKSRQPDMIIAMCGCMMQEEHVVETIKKSYRFVDIIFGTHNIYKLAELLYEYFTLNFKDDVCEGGKADNVKVSEDAEKTNGNIKKTKPTRKKHQMVIDILKGTDKIVEELPSKLKASFKAGVNIMFGCNNFCTYCIVPYVRGRERSRKPEDIVNEIKDFVSKGVLEVMLLGQNVNSYGNGLADEISFPELLKRTCDVPGIERVRFMTSHPKDLSDELIKTIKENDKICRHLHLPLQSGSSRVLKEMNRRYTKEQYIDLALKIRSEIPDLAMTTDIMVGFPGETAEDIDDTIDVINKVKYDNAFTFIYSKRMGTPAAVREDQVPDALVKESFDRVLKVVQNTAKEQSLRWQGQVLDAMVEEENTSMNGFVTGRLSNNMIVHFEGCKDLIGSIVPVRLDECRGFYYMGSRA